MIDVEDIKEWRGGGAICPCGGPISKGAVIGGERWNCRACGRYEIMRNPTSMGIVSVTDVCGQPVNGSHPSVSVPILVGATKV